LLKSAKHKLILSSIVKYGFSVLHIYEKQKYHYNSSSSFVTNFKGLIKQKSPLFFQVCNDLYCALKHSLCTIK